MLVDELKKIAEEIKGKFEEEKGIYIIESVIAVRKAFLTKQKLTYIAKIKIDEKEKIVNFSEMLKEAGSGLSMGGGYDEMSPGFGFKKESYNTTKEPREGNIQEQSVLFGKKYKYDFDYSKVRREIEKLAKKQGYEFKYQIIML